MDMPEVTAPVQAQTSKISMLQEIASAKAKEDVENLLVKCTTLKHASPDTVRKWDRAARGRLATIEKEQHAQANPA